MPDHPWTDEYTLLCEKCGYVIEGLDTDGNCPECGKPIAESIRSDHPGNLWQNSFSFFVIIHSWYLILRHPIQQSQMLKVNEDESFAMNWAVNFIAAALITPAITIFVIAISIDSGWYGNNIIGIIFYTIIAMGYWIVASSYATLASPRVQLIARWRKRRLVLPAARTAVSFASVGFTLSPVLISFSLVLISGLIVLNIDYPTFGRVLTLLWLLSFPASLVLFELLLWLACRRLVFRNQYEQSCQPESPTEPPTTSHRTT